MAVAPACLFVPVSGAGGAGEYYRCVAVAHALLRLAPQARIHFVVSRAARYASQVPFPATVLDDSPTRDVAPVLEYLRRERPNIVVFDSAGRVSQFRLARQVGARVVYVSSRFKTRWKGFRLRRMRLFHQHWIAQPHWLGGALTAWERFKLIAYPSLEVLHLPSVYEPPVAARAATLRADLGVAEGRYVVVCPGGGGRFAGLEDATPAFVEAARQIAARSGLKTVVVGAQSGTSADLTFVGSLPNGSLMDLMSTARLGLINGGSLLTQALSLRVPCVATPIAADQPARIAECERRGLIRAAPLASVAMTDAALSVLSDAGDRTRMQAALDALALPNGADTAAEALLRLHVTGRHAAC